MVWVSQVLGAGEAVTAVTAVTASRESRGGSLARFVPWAGLAGLYKNWTATGDAMRNGMKGCYIFFKANLKQQAEKQKNPPKDSRNKPSFIFETFFNVDWHDHRKLNQRPYSDGACYSPLGLPVAGPRHRAPLPLKCHAETNVTRPTASWETAQFGSLNLTEFSRTSGVERSKKHETPEFL